MAHQVKGTDAVTILIDKDVIKEFADANNPIPIQILSRLEFILNGNDVSAIRKECNDMGETAVGAMLRNRLITRYTDQPDKFTLEEFIDVLINFNTNVKLTNLLRSKCDDVVSSGDQETPVSELKEGIMQEEMKRKPKTNIQIQSAKDGQTAPKKIDPLRKDLKNANEKLEQQQTKKITGCKGSTSVIKSTGLKSSVFDNEETLSFLGGFQLPSKSILLVGGLGGRYGSSLADMEVYCIEDKSKSRNLRTNSNTPRYGHVGWKIGSNKILISGGGTTCGVFVKDSINSTELFDIEMGQWSEGPNMITSRRDAMSAAVGDTFFVFGGQQFVNSNITSAEKFDISGSVTKWQPITNLPHSFVSGKAVAFDDRIWIMGVKTNFLDWQSTSTLIYVPAYDQYNQTTPLDKKVHYFASTLLNSNTIVVTGGCLTGLAVLNSCQMLDIRTRKWETMTDMITPKYNHQLINFDDKLYAIGGQGTNKFVEIYDIRNMKWMEGELLDDWRVQFTAFAM